VEKCKECVSELKKTKRHSQVMKVVHRRRAAKLRQTVVVHEHDASSLNSNLMDVHVHMQFLSMI